MLLAQGIGDTIHVSLAADPVEEVKVGFDILKSLHLRSKGVNVIAFPSCSRLEDIMEHIDVAVIGCVVNGTSPVVNIATFATGGWVDSSLIL